MDNQEHRITHNNQVQTGSLAPNIPNPFGGGDIKFKNDFGETPVGLAHFTKDQGAIAILSLAGAFVGAALGGLPAAGVILLAMMNDIKYAGRAEAPLSAPDGVIDVPSQAIEDTHTADMPQEPVVSESVASKELFADRPTNNHQPMTNNRPLQPDQWTPDLMGYPSILIYGAQGAGKTSTAAWLIRERINTGHQIKILDPHRAYGQWDGLECIGDGMDYDAINDELEAFKEEIKVRYKARSRTPNYDPPKLTLVCDEFTQWAKKCSHSATFFEESLTDIRKINLHVLFISHARTLTGLGGSSGLAATRDAGLLELELEAQVDPVTKKASPKLLGWLKYPGMAMNERQRVAIASWMNGSMDFSGSGVTSTVVQSITEQSNTAEDIRERLEALIKATPHEKVLPQSESARKVLEIIQSASKHPISFESIRKSRKWENNSPDKATLLAVLNEISSEWIRGNEIEGYYLQD